MGKGMKRLVTENHETDQINNPTVTLGTRMHSVTSLPFQPNKTHMAAWTRTRHAPAAEMSWQTGAVSGAEPVNEAERERAMC